MTWLLVSISSYLFFALAALGDKVVLKNVPKPKLYTFYVGFLSIFAVLIYPFINFTLPDKETFMWAFFDGIVYVWGLYVLFSALKKYEVSRVIPTIGAVQPIFIYLIAIIIWPVASLILNQANLIAFFLLLIGGIMISTIT